MDFEDLNVFRSNLIYVLAICAFNSLSCNLSFCQDDEPQLPAVVVQLPTLGVSVDAVGVLSAKSFPDPDGRLNRLRLEAAQKSVPRNLHRKCTYRKVSLKKLERAIQERVDSKLPLTDEMKRMAGLTRVEYVFVCPESSDIIIAGPAEPWIENLAGRFVGAFSGKPIVQLDDWLVAMRVFAPQRKTNPWIACSIDPTADGIENLRKFRANLPTNVVPQMKVAAAKELTARLRNSLGDADVKVYGISPQTHVARVMVEADFRMKAIAIGLEAAPPAIKTFIQVLKGAPKYFQRWWLTPDYECLIKSDDELSIQIYGQGVKLQTETINFGPGARIKHAKVKPSRAARTYAESFTRHFEKLSAARPVFAQLRNVIDMFIVTAWLKKSDAYCKSNWRPSLFVNSRKLPSEQLPEIKKAQSLANGLWKNNVLLLPSGGVSIAPLEALEPGNILIDKNKNLIQKREALKQESSSWWWD